MPDDTITFDDSPPNEIALVRGMGPGIRSQNVYDALLFIGSQFSKGRAARMTHVTSPHFRAQIYNACKQRWPGIRIAQYGSTIDVSPPENGDAP
jgi:hypothetical protein